MHTGKLHGGGGPLDRKQAKQSAQKHTPSQHMKSLINVIRQLFHDNNQHK